jgi:hypothetical protein
MKKLIIAAAMAASVSAVATGACATESYFSLGGGQQMLDFASVGGGEAKITTVTGRLGWRSDSWYGVEGELYAGLGDDEVASGVDVGINASVALYAVAYIPAGEKLNLHARLGFNRLLGEVKAGGGSVETNDGDISYGVGGTYKLSDRDGVRADYTITDISGVDASAWQVAFVRKF